MSENNEKSKEEKKKIEQAKKESEEKMSEEKIKAEELERIKSEAEAAARAELEAEHEQMLRIVADYKNYKKRAEREKSEFIKYANERFVKDLLPSLDALKRAIDSSNNSNDFESFREGVQIIYKQLNNILTKYNVTPIEAIGKEFDPNLHEAIMQIPSKEPKNVVVQEFQKGYMLYDRVIRPSKVIVSAGSSGEEE